jgi:hypothetical protein
VSRAPHVVAAIEAAGGLFFAGPAGSATGGGAAAPMVAAAVRAACGGVAGAVKRDLTFLLPFLVTARFSGRHDST